MKKDQIRIKSRIQLYTAIGSFILFLSWVSQNYFQQKWKSEADKIERIKIDISFNEVNKNIYQIFINSQESKKEIDTAALLYGYRGYESYLNTLGVMGIKLSSDDTVYVQKNETKFNDNNTAIASFYQSKDLDKFREFADSLSEWENNKAPAVIKNYQRRLSEVKDLESNWNGVYLVSYIIGALFLAIAFLINYSSLEE